MKKFIIFAVALATSTLAGCQQDLVPGYSGKTNIYFTFADHNGTEAQSDPWPKDSTMVFLGFDGVPKADTVIRIPVRIQGDMVDYDRPFLCELDPDQSSATTSEIEVLPSFIPANNNNGFLSLKIIRTGKVGKNRLRAVLWLVSNNEFHTDYHFIKKSDNDKYKGMNATCFKVLFNYYPEMPRLWALYEDGFTLWYGVFSEKKLQVICDVCGLTRDDFDYDPKTEDPSEKYNNNFTLSTNSTNCRMIRQYLEEYKTTHGEPLLDEDGSEMTLGSNAYLN